MCECGKQNYCFRLCDAGRFRPDRRCGYYKQIKNRSGGPQVFTATLSRKLIVPAEKQEKSRILAVVGSVNPNTKTQMEELWLSQRTHNVFVHTKELLEGDSRRENEIERVTEEILSESSRNIVSTVVGDGIYPENRIDFIPYMEKYNCSMDEVTERINSAFAEITYRIFQKETEVSKDFIRAEET